MFFLNNSLSTQPRPLSPFNVNVSYVMLNFLYFFLTFIQLLSMFLQDLCILAYTITYWHHFIPFFMFSSSTSFRLPISPIFSFLKSNLGLRQKHRIAVVKNKKNGDYLQYNFWFPFTLPHQRHSTPFIHRFNSYFLSIFNFDHYDIISLV